MDIFPCDDVDLYDVLGLDSGASQQDIGKAYRKLALLCHPDKHTNSSEHERAHASKRFQQIGFAYAVLGDEARRKKYDRTGTTSEGLFDSDDLEGGWDAYFQDLFDSVTRGRLDEMKREYQGREKVATALFVTHTLHASGSPEETQDLTRAYLESEGSLGEIMKHVPHSTTEDEPRFVSMLSELVSRGELPDLPLWQSTSKDEKAKRVRMKQGEKEANEAEELAKELGVWDEFYGSGKVGARKGKGKQKDTAGDEDVSGLQALILQKQKARNGFLDNLAAKYLDEETSSKKKRKKEKVVEPEEIESPRKRSRTVEGTSESTQSKPKAKTSGTRKSSRANKAK